MERFFQYRDRWGNGLTLWVLVAMLFSLPLIGQGLRKVRLENNVTNWLPADDPEARILKWFGKQFHNEDRLIVSWDSSSLTDPRVNEFAERLRGNDTYAPIEGILDVSTPGDILKVMEQNGIDEETAVERLTGVVIGSGFLKISLTAHGQKQRTTAEVALVEEASRIVGRHVSVIAPVPMREGTGSTERTSNDATEPSPQDREFEETETEDGENETFEDDQNSEDTVTDNDASTDVLRTFRIPPHDLQLKWSGISPRAPVIPQLIEDLQSLELDGQPVVDVAFFASGAPVAVTIALKELETEGLERTFQEIEEAAIAAGIPPEELHLGGSPVGRNRMNREAQRAVWNPTYPAWNPFKRSPVMLSAIVGVVFSFLLLRSIRLGILVVLASLYAVMVVVALIPATGSNLNMVLIVLPDLLLVLTTSGAIHVANYWKHAVSEEETFPIAKAVGMASVPCFLASATTAIGMASLMSAVLGPVREFGFYSSIGCFVSLAMVLLGFPSLLSIWSSSQGNVKSAQSAEARFWNALGWLLVRWRWAVVLCSLIIFAGCCYGLRWFSTETKVIRYFPEHTRIIQDYNFLEDSLSGLVSIDAVVEFDDSAREELNILERIEIVRHVETSMAEHPWVSGTLSLADFRPESYPLDEEASFLEKVRYRKKAQRTEKGIFEEHAEHTESLVRLADQPLQLSQAGRDIDIATGNEIWRIRAQATVMGDVDYEVLTSDLNKIVHDALPSAKGVDFLVTGLVPLFLRTQQAVLESLIRSFVLAFGVIALVMIALLRSPLSGSLAMLPNLFPVGVVFGLVSWARIPVDIGTMITASVALGIAIDGTLHLLTWFQEGIRRGETRHAAVVHSLQHCGPAMWQTSVSIAAGILMLAGADLLLISRFGWLMAALIVAALVADVILLPALLASSLGALIERGVQARSRVPEDL